MTATYDLLTAVGQVRLRISDKDLTAPVFQDEEINYFLGQNNGDLIYAAADLLEVIANDPKRMAQYTRGGVSVTREDLFVHAQEMRRRRDAELGVQIESVTRTDFYTEE